MRMFEMVLSEEIRILADRVQELESERDECVRKVQNWNKDTEIQKIKAEYESYRRHSYHLNEKERELEQEFLDKHQKSCGLNFVCQLIFTPTHICTFVDVKCNKCGEVKSLL